MRKSVIGTIVAVLAMTAITFAQTNRVEDRFTFKAPNWTPSSAFGPDWLELVIDRWSTDAEREQVLASLKEHGPSKLGDAISRGSAVGYLHWPGGLNYTLRFAYRVAAPDGGEDIIVGIDRPISLWWNTGATPGVSPDAVVLQLRVNKDGKGEGKIVSKATVNPNTKSLVFDDFATAPSILVDVQRNRGVSGASSAS